MERIIIHIDVKPANIFMGVENEYLLGDFGSAISMESAKTRYVGTPEYMSPEAKDGKFTQKSDIYSLGKSLFYLYTGQFSQEDVKHENALLNVLKKAFFEKTPAEQKQAVVSQPEEVRDALRRAHAAKAAQDMFLCLPELSKEKAALKRSKEEAAQKESAGRIASLEKEMKECRRTVVAFMRGNTVTAALRRGSPER